ncbi:S-layer homology domain-containing protein [Paenibacillus lutrae]|uniref:SLH domain-containing protein n=1 Tax=Paenibacillus lutrae TaxID=2078573 RepID=A0A7X3K1G9_9BACL|nr:S-layer homology domain-containing protein [Paenibacillus lutrae]MVP02122.1 hypothetical protein [Paenibacillus lutrae]
MIKKSISLFLSMSFLLSTGCKAEEIDTVSKASATAAAAQISFSDISYHWAEKSIKAAVSTGYVDGYDDQTFRPDQKISRAEFVKMITTSLKLPTTQVEGEWYIPYINTAVNGGLHRWSDFTSGDWNTSLTRMEMSRIVVRATQKELQDPKYQMPDSGFLFNATKTGIMQGLSNGQLGKDEPTTRAQAITMIERILKINKGEKLPVDKNAMAYAEVEMRGTNAETVWGMRTKQFPIKDKLGDGLDLQINKMIIVDKTKSDSAFNELYYDPNPKAGTDIYVIAYHITINNLAKKGDYTIYPTFMMSMTSLPRALTRTDDIQIFNGNDTGLHSGWIAFCVPKKDIEEILSRNDVPRIDLNIPQSFINMNEEKGEN